jgi:hypothetical protein
MPPPTTAPNGRYTKREATGRIEEINDDGLKINGVWWNNSRRQPIDLTAYHVNDGVYVCADETSDGGRRFLLAVEPVQTARPAPRPGESSNKPAAPAVVDDMPDDWPDEEVSGARGEARARIADRLECLRIAAGTLTPSWVKRGTDPDVPAMLGIADKLLDWLYRAENDR